MGVISIAVLTAGIVGVGLFAVGVISIGYLASGVIALGWKAANGVVAVAYHFADGQQAVATHAADAVARDFIERSVFLQTGDAILFALADWLQFPVSWILLLLFLLLLPASIRIAYRRKA